MVLGRPLPASAGVRTYALELREAAHPDGKGEHAHAGGSLAAYPDSGAAAAELRNCRRSAAASGALFCMKVDNVLVILGGEISPTELRRVQEAGLALGATG